MPEPAYVARVWKPSPEHSGPVMHLWGSIRSSVVQAKQASADVVPQDHHRE